VRVENGTEKGVGEKIGQIQLGDAGMAKLTSSLQMSKKKRFVAVLSIVVVIVMAVVTCTHRRACGDEGSVW